MDFGGREALQGSVYSATCAQPCVHVRAGGPHLHARFLDGAVQCDDVRAGTGVGALLAGVLHTRQPTLRLHHSHHARECYSIFLCSLRVIPVAGGPGSRGRTVAGWWPWPFFLELARV